MVETLVPIALFATVAVIVGLITYFRFRSVRETQETVRTLLHSGQPVSEESMRALVLALTPGELDLRRGVIAFAISAGLAALAFAADEGSVVYPLLGVAAFPCCLGVAYFILWKLNERRRAD